MALLLKCGAVFLHVPKTGGSWVTEVLEEQNLVQKPIGHIHSDMYQVLRYYNTPRVVFNEVMAHVKNNVSVETKLKLHRLYRSVAAPEKNQSAWARQEPQVDTTPYTFCFVRHPLRWYESFWCYMQDNSWPLLGSPYKANAWHPCSALNGLGSPDFNVFMQNVVNKAPGFVSQMYGLFTGPGVNFVGKQERLVDDLIDTLKLLNVRFDENKIRSTGRVNGANRKERDMKWDPSLEAEVLKLEYVALRRFDYPVSQSSEPLLDQRNV